MVIDTEQWSKWIVSLGLEFANIDNENELRFKAHTIQLGMEKIVDEMDRRKADRLAGKYNAMR